MLTVVGMAGPAWAMIDVRLFRSRAFQGISPHVVETLSRHSVARELAGFRAELPAGVTATIDEKGTDACAGGFAAAMSLAAIV